MLFPNWPVDSYQVLASNVNVSLIVEETRESISLDIILIWFLFVISYDPDKKLDILL